MTHGRSQQEWFGISAEKAKKGNGYNSCVFSMKKVQEIDL